MIEQNIETGDYVRHKSRIINGGLQMTVQDVEGTNAKCTHFAGEDMIATDEWFPFEQLELIRKADGGFF
jgi:uncharacterized protein YodC (DUF2158 family)